MCSYMLKSKGKHFIFRIGRAQIKAIDDKNSHKGGKKTSNEDYTSRLKEDVYTLVSRRHQTFNTKNNIER